MKKFVLFAVAIAFGSNVALAHSIETEKPSPAQGRFVCKLYKLNIPEGGAASGQLLRTAQSNPFPVGTFMQHKIDFPAPYAKYSVVFAHTLVNYVESGNDEFLPFIAAYFLSSESGGNPVGEVRDAMFASVSGTQVLLRDVMAIAGTSSWLTYQCGFNVL